MPVTWLRLLAHWVTLSVPPSEPRSIILPFFHKKGSAVGNPVVGFGVKLVNDVPATISACCSSQGPVTKESGPPSVPRSRMTPFFHRKACVGDGNGPRPLKEKGSKVVSTVATPTTSPASFM